ncbi:MAG: SET domain-containing protein-lysine N-methyltransferase [Chromatiales bacterium]|nr:SET domain-containing protein-lysine N-methyltransferase [Chromatiales bacterium]
MLIYPDVALEEGYDFPQSEQFLVAEREDGKGKAVYTMTGHARGEMVARFTGPIVPYRTQHTLQLNPNLHVLDLHFVGYFAHSCSPNVFVDMQEFEVWALQDIAPETALTMDYAATEDELFRQFRCLCGNPNCRHWITGRKERVNGEGMYYLQSLQEQAAEADAG